MKFKWIPFVLGLSLFASFSALALSAYSTFWDVSEDAWYADSVERLAELGILQGDPDGSYRPSDSVNRAELAVVLDRLLSYVETGTVPIEERPASVQLEVPFTSQAPTGDWGMPYQEACEEASLLMVESFWADSSITVQSAEEDLLALSAWVEVNGYAVDVGAEEVLEIAEAYYGLEGQVYYDDAVNVESLMETLAAGYPVILPMAGQELGNPYYTGEGPPYHMLVLVGYNTTGFITHDPGTSHGAFYEYSYDTIENAIHDWTGSKSTASEGRKAMVVLRKGE